jgi:SAM-dependent methyltransferase
MSSLYKNLATVYEAMYQTFINYSEEYIFYSEILAKYKVHSIVEIGCGTGHLAKHFIKNNYSYRGIDSSDDMLLIAQKNNPNGVFENGLMQNFNLQDKVDACVITGRTISYLISHDDVANTFHSIHKNLKPLGIVCFDFIDANKFIPYIYPEKAVTHKANYNSKKYQRDSVWKANFKEGFSCNWSSIYYEEIESGKLVEIGRDEEMARTFTKDEIVLFLQLANFEIKEIIERPSYFFDTLVIVAQIKN